MNTSQMVAVVAGCVLQQDGKYLLVQEKIPKVYGLWNLPAGHVDVGESIEAAAAREVLEETGLTVQLNTKLPVYHTEATRPVPHAYTATITGGEFTPNLDELLDAKWLALAEVRALHQAGKLRTDWVLESIEAAA
ncbi:MAG TPA: NUDIX hydrolase [Candidatus Saccharimonadales bacterium]|nr:NUDIX hydrolase [Candidatus Saccharimonadales bacterium]